MMPSATSLRGISIFNGTISPRRWSITWRRRITFRSTLQSSLLNSGSGFVTHSTRTTRVYSSSETRSLMAGTIELGDSSRWDVPSWAFNFVLDYLVRRLGGEPIAQELREIDE